MSTDNIIVDLSNYKDRVGSRVTPGTYRVQVEDAEPGVSKANNQMINLWLRVIDGEHEGATIVDRLTMTENALFRVVGFMQAIGLPTPKKRISINLRNIVGKVLDVEVDDGEPYNGRVKSEVRGYMKPAKGQPEVSDFGGDLPEDLEEAPEIPAAVQNLAAQRQAAPAAASGAASAAAQTLPEDDGTIDLEEVEY